MALKQLTVWKDRANPAFIELVKNGTTLTDVEMASITKVEILYSGVYYNSDDYPDSFDWATYAATGKVVIRAGLLPLSVGSDVAELLIYDVTNTAGIMWTQIAVQVRDDVLIT